MNAFDVLMSSSSSGEASWRKSVGKPPRTRRERQPKRGLLAYMRPADWVSQPLDLGTDVVTMIAEALMRSDGCQKVRAIKALALVNRLCAAAVASTLDHVRARLQHNGQEYALAAKAKAVRMRHEAARSAETAALVAEAVRLMHVHEDYMEEVGIPIDRRLTLTPFADRTWFHDNRSLLGHLAGGCELCPSPLVDAAAGERCGYQFIDGPVMLIACVACKAKGCVELDISYADATGQVLEVRVDREETVANNYARALLSKQAAHLKRMRSKRATRVPPARLGKRVHRVGVTDALGLCYWNSNHRMSRGSWRLELWHTLPEGLPQGATFGALMGVRNSDKVRKEARDHAALLRARRRDAALKRRALVKLECAFRAERDAVRDVVRAGAFEGWVQAMELCSTARAFEARWLFRWGEHGGRVPSEWRDNQQKLVQMDRATLGAAARRVATVARVLYRGFRRTTTRCSSYCLEGSAERFAMLSLMRNFSPAFLERGPAVVDRIVELVRCAAIELTYPANAFDESQVRTVAPNLARPRTTAHNNPPSQSIFFEQALLVTYTLVGEPFDGRRMEIVSYFSDHIVQRICKKFGFLPMGEETLTQVMVRGLRAYVNRPSGAGADNHDRALRNDARAEIFGLPAVWPTWLLA